MMDVLVLDHPTTAIPRGFDFPQATAEVLVAFQHWRVVCEAFDLVEPEEVVERVKEMNTAQQQLKVLLNVHQLGVINAKGQRVCL